MPTKTVTEKEARATINKIRAMKSAKTADINKDTVKSVTDNAITAKAMEDCIAKYVPLIKAHSKLEWDMMDRSLDMANKVKLTVEQIKVVWRQAFIRVYVKKGYATDDTEYNNFSSFVARMMNLVRQFKDHPMEYNEWKHKGRSIHWVYMQLQAIKKKEVGKKEEERKKKVTEYNEEVVERQKKVRELQEEQGLTTPADIGKMANIISMDGEEYKEPTSKIMPEVRGDDRSPKQIWLDEGKAYAADSPKVILVLMSWIRQSEPITYGKILKALTKTTT